MERAKGAELGFCDLDFAQEKGVRSVAEDTLLQSA